MPRPRHQRLQAAIRRLLPSPAPEADADLLGRYVAGRDEGAFEALVRRHGPMVHGVCRRELGPGPDADDAFQVAFLVLARDARRIARGAALPGWLYRVARMAALKLRGKRRLTVPVRDDDAVAEVPDAVADRELWAALDRELGALPDKLRAAFVLCCLEDRSSTDAARVLGCPVGTVDSRLAAARRKLRDRLALRGFGLPAAGFALVTAGGVADASVARLLPSVVEAAGKYAAGGLTDSLSLLADGVTPIMTTVKLKLLAAAGVSLVVFGTAGFGLFPASADEKPKPVGPPLAVEIELGGPKKADIPPKKADAAELADEAAVRTALRAPGEGIEGQMTLKALFEHLHGRYGINARLDTAAFKRLGGADTTDEIVDGTFVLGLYDTMVQFPTASGLSVADVLTEAVAQIPGHCRYRVRGNQVLVGPAFQPPAVPGGNVEENGPQVNPRRMLEQIFGEPVSVAVDDKPFTDAVKELRKLTGANVVIDARCKEAAREPVSGTFDDTRLLTVLTVFADQCGLKPVAMNNVYYVTTVENAARLQKEVNRDLFGRTAEPSVAGGASPPGPAPAAGR